MSTQMQVRGCSPGDALAHNVRELRRRRNLSQEGLADAVSALGVAMRRPAVAKIEDTAAERRRPVSVEELLALAVALDVAPARLYLPMPDDTRGGVAVTPTTVVSPQTAWLWTAEQQPVWLTEDYAPEDDPEARERMREWSSQRARVVGEVPAVIDASGSGLEAAERRRMAQRLDRLDETLDQIADVAGLLRRAEQRATHEAAALKQQRDGSTGPRQRGREGSQ